MSPRVNSHSVILCGHSDILNTFNIKRRQIQLVRPTREIRHRIRLVPRTEHKHVITWTADQLVVPGTADEGIIALPPV